MRTRWMGRVLATLAVWGLTYGLKAQDTRTVTEPVFPPVCTVIAAQQAIVSGQPASETTFDTSRIQTALTACGSGNAVELTSSGTNYAFLIQPITIPSGVSLIVDGGVTVFASRNPADYQTSSTELCGTYGASGNGCNLLITFTKNGTGSGIYGYGVIDGRGGSTLLSGANAGITWWANADNANTAGQSQDNFIIMKPSTNNLTLYKITLRNSPMFHVGWAGTGFTAWGVKIQAPFSTHNTDGIDPDGTNVTITNSSISDGDDNVAVGASSAAANITISNVTTYSGHGISVGSYTQGGLTNMLVSNVNMAGTAQDTNATGIRLKSSQDRGGLVQNVTYSSMCVKDIHHILQFTPFYNTNSGTLIPQFKNITLQNVHFLTPTTNQYPYLVQMQGHDANYPASVTLNNVVFDQLLAANVTPASEYINFTLAGNVYPAFLQSLPGTNVTYTGTATSSATTGALSCPSTVFPYVVGELYLSSVVSAQQYAQTIASGATVTLNAMVQPAMAGTAFSGTAGSWAGAPALTQPINFYEGTSLVGTGTLGANGTVASATLSGVTVGTHTYTAQYPGDTNYAALSFGSVTVTVTAQTAVASTTTLTGASGGVYGTSVTLTAKVAPVSGSNVPTGTVKFLDGSTVIATVTLASGSASTTQVFGGGSHSLTASYLGDTNDQASVSGASAFTVTTATATAALTASPASIAIGASTTLTAQLTGVSSGSTPTGTVTFYDGSTNVGTGAVGTSGAATLTATPTTVATHSYTASYGGDTNYGTATSAAAPVVVSLNSTTTALTAAPSTLTYGTGTLLTAAIAYATGTPTGTVKFYDGATLLATVTVASGGAATTQVLTGGSHSLTAVYSGDGNFATSTSTVSAVTVNLATTTSGLTAAPASVTAGTGTVLTAAISSTVTGTPTGSVKFYDGATLLATVTVASGGATTTQVLTIGSHSLTAVYSGDGNYATSTSTAASASVTAATSSTGLTLSAATTYVGGSETLTATVTSVPGTPSGTVTFANASGTLGTGTLNGSGVATLTLTETVAGAQSITATYAASGNFGGSASAASSLSVVAPIALTLTSTTASLAAGASTTVTATATPAGGFTGAVSYTCTPAVSYVTCSLSTGSGTVSGTGAVSTVATISVASSVAEVRINPVAWVAGLLPLSLLGLRRRRVIKALALVVTMIAMAGLGGCGGASSSSGGSTTQLPPAGTQSVTITAATSAASVSSTVTVTVTN